VAHCTSAQLNAADPENLVSSSICSEVSFEPFMSIRPESSSCCDTQAAVDWESMGVENQGQRDFYAMHLRELGRAILCVTKPSTRTKREKSDLPLWREIFALYKMSSIFCVTQPCTSLITELDVVKQRHSSFWVGIEQKDYTKLFRHPGSQQVLDDFRALVSLMIKNLETPSPNMWALTSFQPPVGIIGIDKELIRWLCFEINERLTTLIPQLDDYTCPLCTTIVWKPGESPIKSMFTFIVRLICGHVFCLSCMVELQKLSHRDCPMCRKPVVLDADSSNLDTALMNLLKLYFPEEVRIKQKTVEQRLLERSVVYQQNQCKII